MKNFKMNLFNVCGTILLISGLVGFARYGIQTENHYSHSLSDLSSILLGTSFIFFGLESKYRKKYDNFANSFYGNMTIFVLSSLFSYVYISVALDSGEIIDYIIGIAFLVVTIFTLKKLVQNKK